jgi:hypothetical protein
MADRLLLQLHGDGQASLRLLDAGGEVVRELLPSVGD